MLNATNACCANGYVSNPNGVFIERIMLQLFAKGGKGNMAQVDDYALNYKKLSVKMSDGSCIKGKVNLGADYKRLSDFLKHSSDKFITVVQEDIEENSKKIFIVNKDCIVWADTED